MTDNKDDKFYEDLKRRTTLSNQEENARLDALLGPLTEGEGDFELPCITISGVIVHKLSDFTPEKRKELNLVSRAEINELFIRAVFYDDLEQIDFLCQEGNSNRPDVHYGRDIAFKMAAQRNLNTLEHLLTHHLGHSTPAIDLFLKERDFQDKDKVITLVNFHNEKNSFVIDLEEGATHSSSKKLN